MGHEIAAGASYCAHGHPLALDNMQFSNDAYGAPPQQQAQAPQAAYGAPQQAQPYGAPMQPTGAMAGYDQQQPQAYAPPQQAGQPANPYGATASPQQQAVVAAQPYGAAAAPATPFATPQTQPPNNLYGAPQPGFGAPTPGFDAPQPAAFGAPPPQAAPAERGTPMVLPPSALRGFLITYQSNTKGDYWPLYGGRLTVGRASSGDQVDIPLADATISSRHAALVIDGVQGGVQVEDTGSTNGTFVNEEHLGFNGRRELRDGDRIRFGGFTTIVKLIGRI